MSWGQSFLDAEDGRVRDFLRTVGARAMNLKGDHE